jgi:hypothetical protein
MCWSPRFNLTRHSQEETPSHFDFPMLCFFAHTNQSVHVKVIRSAPLISTLAVEPIEMKTESVTSVAGACRNVID